MALIQEYAPFLIGGALVLGFVFAWIVRGLRKSPTEQRAIVDRDIALLELQQTKDELDSLFAAQRKRRAEEKASGAQASDPALKAEIARLEQALSEAKAEAKALREAPPAVAAEAVPTPPVQAAKTRSPEETALRNALISRNEYLEGRIHDVELRLHHMSKDLKAAKAAASKAQPTEAPASKTAWLSAYQKQRMEALEAKLVEAGLVAGTSGPEAAPETPPEAPEDPAMTRKVDEELARLRWRNRYLESRLAYLAEAVDPQEEEAEQQVSHATQPAARPDAPKAAIAPAPATAKSAEPVRPAATPQSQQRPAAQPVSRPDRLAERGPRFTSPASSGPPEGGVFSALASAATKTSGTAPVAAAVETKPERPPALDAADGKADDLTRISGLSSSIELRLNELGIWHFRQIAEWTPEQLAWIDREFGLDGMARREGWPSQARQLG